MTDPLTIAGLPYALVAPAGEGRLGVVWQALHLESGSTVAFKVLTTPRAGSSEVLRAFRTEFRNAVGLDHPNVAAVYDAGVLPAAPELEALGLRAALPWVASEWLPWQPLVGRRLPWPRLRELMVEVLDALAHVHAHGLTHGAVSAANVRTDAEGAAVRLSDLGMGRVELVAKDLTDLSGAQAPFQEDFAALGRLVREAAGRDAPPALAQWASRLRRRISRPSFRHAAEAVEALLQLDTAPPSVGLGVRVMAPAPPADWRRPGESASDRRARVLPPVGPGSRLVPIAGREAERDQLWAALRTVFAERRVRGVILEGPEGSGKRTLARWLALRAAEAGSAHILQAFHSPVPGPDLGLAPMLVRFLDCAGLPAPLARQRADRRLSAIGLRQESDRAEVIELFAPPLRPVSDTPALRLLNPAERHDRLLRAIRALSARRPVILLLHDLQWGPDALALVERLLDEGSPGGAPVLVVMTLRSDLVEPRPDVALLVQRLTGRPEVGTVTLAPLTPVEARLLLEKTLRLHPATAARVSEVTGNNPLFAVELVRDLAEGGYLVERTGALRALANPKAHLPGDVEQVWTSRLGRLLQGRPESDGAAIELAAVLGGVVNHQDWVDVGEAAALDWSDDLVEALMDAGLAAPLADGAVESWVFGHGTLVRTMVRRAGRGQRLVSLHRSCASVIEERLLHEPPGGAEETALYARLIRHLVSAGDLDRALTPLIRVVRALVQAGEVRQAVAMLVAGTPAVEELDRRPGDHRLGEVWVLQAELAGLRGDVEEMALFATRAEASARRHDWKTVLAHALVLRARVARHRGNAALASRRAFDAEGIADDLGDRWLRGTARLETGELAMEQGELDEAEDLLLGAMSDFEKLHDQAGVGSGQLALARLAHRHGDREEAERRLADAMQTFEASGRRWGVAECLAFQGEVLRHAGEVDAAVEALEAALDRYLAVGTAAAVGPRVGLALARAMQGDWRRARRELDELRQEIGSSGHQGLLATVLMALAACAVATEDWLAYDRALNRGRLLLKESGYVAPDVLTWSLRAGDMAEAAYDARRSRRAWRVAVRQLEGLGRQADAEALRDRIRSQR